MKITICGSMSFLDKMKKTQEILEKHGHEVFIPEPEESSSNTNAADSKRKYDYIRKHLNLIEDSDAILVINETKNNIKNYIGANSFLEIGFAHYKNKKIFLLNDIPQQKYIDDELRSFNLHILTGNLDEIK